MFEQIGTFTWTDIMGLIGVVIYISNYFLLRASIIHGRGYLYPSLVMVAATCVLISVTTSFNLSSLAIQVAYILISIFGITRFYLRSRRIDFSTEELAILHTLVPNLTPSNARDFLKLGVWADHTKEIMLTEEGKPVEKIQFLLSGSADVRVNDRSVTTLHEGSLVGEMAWISGMPASATVSTNEQSRVFSIDVDRLHKFLVRNPLIRHTLEGQFANQLGEKLRRANQSASAVI